MIEKYKGHIINGSLTILAVLAVSAAVTREPNKKSTAQSSNTTGAIQQTLKRGDSGAEMKKVQEILLSAPDLFADGSVTGKFDQATEKAIKKFQIKNRLEITGRVDGATVSKLNEFNARTAQYQQLKLTNVEAVGRFLKLTGTGFTTDGNSIEIKGRITLTDLRSIDGTTLTFSLPQFVPCKIGSACPVKVINHNGISNAVPFKLSQAPTPPPAPSPSPSPAPTPSPTPTPTPTPPPSLNTNTCQQSASTPVPVRNFKILSPNGGENWSFGSNHPITWQGGDPSWPICISLINSSRTQVLRYLASGVANDGTENWIVDVPPGEYIMYADACRGCANMDWDYSDAKFTVNEGSFYGKVSSAYSTNQSLVLLTPKSSDEIWSAGQTYDILWSGGESNWTISMYLIDRTTNTTAIILFTGLANDGKASWTMPSSVAPGLYSFYIACGNCPEGTFGNYAYSFHNFTVLYPN